MNLGPYYLGGLRQCSNQSLKVEPSKCETGTAGNHQSGTTTDQCVKYIGLDARDFGRHSFSEHDSLD